MQNTISSPLISINDQSVTWSEVFGCMQLFGKLQPFLQDFVSQYVLIQEIKQREDLEVDSADVMQAIMDFRLKKEITEQDKFQAWLQRENLDNVTFQQRVVLELKAKLLKQAIAAPKLQAYFDEHQASFEQFRLFCLWISDKETAEQLKARIEAGEDKFLPLANEYSASDSEITVKFSKQQLQRRSLPTQVRPMFATVSAGAVVGPVEIPGGWSIFRVEEVIPAELDEKLTRQLESQIFAQWLADQLREMKISFDAQPDSLVSG